MERSWRERLHPHDVAPTLARWQHCLRTGQPYEVEYRFRNAQGDYRWMLGRALPSRNEQGDIIQWIGTYTDIHEHKLALERIDHAQRQLHDNNEQLTRANVDLDNFIYTASHDLKAPISNIEGLLHALLVELPRRHRADASRCSPFCDLMQDSVNRFKRTIEHLTDVSKLQKEHGLPTQPGGPGGIIHDVRLDLEPLVRAAGARLGRGRGGRPTVFFPRKTCAAWFSTCSAMPSNTATRPAAACARALPRRRRNSWCWRCRTTAWAWTANNEQKLFGMFQRFHDHVEGSGIGLYMVKKMVENAGGRIQVRSRLGVGTTFSVYFAR